VAGVAGPFHQVGGLVSTMSSQRSPRQSASLIFRFPDEFWSSDTQFAENLHGKVSLEKGPLTGEHKSCSPYNRGHGVVTSGL
jgi:hypothetical protein